MFVEGFENSVIFQKRRDVAGCGEYGKAKVDRVAKNAGISEIVACCDGRSIRHCESRDHGMTVRERDPSLAESCHFRCGMRIDRSTTKAVCHEQHEIIAAFS